MSFDTVINIALLALVFQQIREAPVTLRGLIRPMVLVSAAAIYYLHAIPTAGNDLVLTVGLALVGAGLGTAAAMVTSMRRGPDGEALAKAGGVAAFLWVAGISARMIFVYAVNHGAAGSIATFSRAHDITSQDAWVAALVLMSITEAAFRLGIMQYRAYRIRTAATAAPASARRPLAV